MGTLPTPHLTTPAASSTPRMSSATSTTDTPTSTPPSRRSATPTEESMEVTPTWTPPESSSRSATSLTELDSAAHLAAVAAAGDRRKREADPAVIAGGSRIISAPTPFIHNAPLAHHALGYGGLGYAGLGYHGLGYAGLGYGYGLGLGHYGVY